MKIQGQSYESVVDCVSFSNWKSYPNLHISTHRIDMSGIIKIIIFSSKGRNHLQFSWPVLWSIWPPWWLSWPWALLAFNIYYIPLSSDYHHHPSGDHLVHPYKIDDHSHVHTNHSDDCPKYPKTILTTILNILITIQSILMTIQSILTIILTQQSHAGLYKSMQD